MKKNTCRAFLLAQICGVIVAAVWWATPARAWDKGLLSDYHERRARLLEQTGDGVIVLFGYGEDEIAVSTTRFRQNEMFYYLTGWSEPNGMLLLVPKASSAKRNGGGPEIDKEILFIPAHDYRAEKWTGPKLGPDDADAIARTGFPTVKSSALFQAELLEALKTFPKIYTELTPQPESGEDRFVEEMVSKLHKLAPLAALEDVRPLLTRMRMVKSPAEIALMRKAVEASLDAHLAAMKAVHPGVWEYEIAALMKYEFERRGCEWPAYPPIVGSGFFSTVLLPPSCRAARRRVRRAWVAGIWAQGPRVRLAVAGAASPVARPSAPAPAAGRQPAATARAAVATRDSRQKQATHAGATCHAESVSRRILRLGFPASTNPRSIRNLN